MLNWNYDPNQYTENNFKPLDEGDYRVRIIEATFKEARNGNIGLEIRLDVSGKAQKLWHYIWFDYDNARLTNQRLGEFFNSFDISLSEQDNLSSWKGKYGGVRVKHVEYEGRILAKVSFCLNQEYQKRLPEWEDKTTINNPNRTELYEDFPSSKVATISPTAQIAPRTFNGLSF